MRYSILEATPDAVKAAGGKGLNVMRHSKIIYAEMTKEQASALKAKGYSVVEARKTKPAITTAPPEIRPPEPIAAEPVYTPEMLVSVLGIDKLRSITYPPLTGEGFTVAILGTGIRLTHELIGGSVVAYANYTNSPDGDAFDHDTGVASIIHAAAPGCSIVDYKVVDDFGEGTEEAFVEAMDDLIDLVETNSEFAPQVVNLSLGAEDVADPMSPIRVVCREALNRGLWIVAAAGNSGPSPGTVLSPACERYVIAVGSVGYLPSQVSWFSSRGPTPEGLVKPDIVMCGENIKTASSMSDTATVAKSGTSFSAPFASAIAILLKNGEQVWREENKPVGMPPTYEPLYFNGLVLPMTQGTMVDSFLPFVCVKLSGLAEKDNNYGYGTPSEPLMVQHFNPGVAVGTTNILVPAMALIMMIPIIGMIME